MRQHPFVREAFGIIEQTRIALLTLQQLACIELTVLKNQLIEMLNQNYRNDLIDCLLFEACKITAKLLSFPEVFSLLLPTNLSRGLSKGLF